MIIETYLELKEKYSLEQEAKEEEYALNVNPLTELGFEAHIDAARFNLPVSTIKDFINQKHDKFSEVDAWIRKGSK